MRGEREKEREREEEQKQLERSIKIRERARAYSGSTLKCLHVEFKRFAVVRAVSDLCRYFHKGRALF